MLPGGFFSASGLPRKLGPSKNKGKWCVSKSFRESAAKLHQEKRIEMKKLIYLLLVGVVLLSLGSNNAFGQASASATLQGTVTDQSDSAIKGTKVALTSKEQGWTRSTDTSDTGSYRFELLPAGTYSIKVNVSGFSTAEAKDVVLQVGATTTQNFTLRPGSVSETIEVTSDPALVDQQKMDVSTNITPQQIQDLPLIARCARSGSVR